MPAKKSIEPLVSVITPFYNTADYLRECIESVQAQSYSNFELVLVDNCSTDGSDKIAHEMALRDSRLRVVRNPRFLTQLQNFNGALLHMSKESRYCKMVLADDTIYPSCLSEMVALAEANPTVAVVSSYRLYGTHVLPDSIPISHEQGLLSGRDACRMVLIDDIYTFGSQTTVMFRSDVVRARVPFFDESRFFADADVVYELLADHDFGFVHQILSFSRCQSDSTWGSVMQFKPALLSQLLQLKTYGPKYLSPDECKRHVAACERAYRRYLAKSWLRRRPPAFWQFHEKGLSTIGETIDRSALVRDAALVALDYTLSPKAVGAGIYRRMRRVIAAGVS